MEMVTLEELEPLLSEKGYLCLGHGTGRSKDSEEVINSILENGLRTKDNSLYFTTVVLNTSTVDILKDDLNNWKHLNSKKIIIVRIPIEYINCNGDRSDLDGEMYGAFFNEVKEENGDIKYYLDSRFILGYYDVDSKMFVINNKYEKEFSEKTKNKMKLGYLKAVKKTKERLDRINNRFVR